MTSHRVKRIRCLSKVQDSKTAFSVRQKIRMYFEGDIATVLEREFDTACPADDVIHIPRITLAIQLEEDQDFRESFGRKLREALSAELNDRILHNPVEHSVRRLRARQSRQQFLHSYLESGRLEWHLQVEDINELMVILKDQAEIAAADPSLIRPLLTGSLSQRIAVSFRLLQLLPPEARLQLVTHSRRQLGQDAGHHHAATTEDELPVRLNSVIHELSSSALSSGLLQIRLQSLLVALRSEDLRQPLSVDIVNVLEPLLGMSTAAANLLPALLERAHELISSDTSDLSRGKPLPEAANNGIDQQPGAIKEDADSARSGPIKYSSLQGTAGVQPSSRAVSRQHIGRNTDDSGHQGIPLKAFQDDAPERLNIPPSTVLPSVIETKSSGSNQIESTSNLLHVHAIPIDDILLNDAGLILLHPFIAYLFEATQIWKAGMGTLPESSLARAATLLHWLATGRDEIHEFELLTTKLLLGIEPDSILLADRSLLTEEDKAEGNAMLKAVIGHWGALGETSPDGLRISFLQRRGLLRDAGQHWQLQVETESFDMLLGRLPWGISIVKLPWMTKPIFVEWPTP